MKGVYWSLWAALPSMLPASGKQSHGMRVKLLHGQCSHWRQITQNGSNIMFESREKAFPDKHAGQRKSRIPLTSTSYCKYSVCWGFFKESTRMHLHATLVYFHWYLLLTLLPFQILVLSLSPPRLRADTSLTLPSPLVETLFPLL